MDISATVTNSVSSHDLSVRPGSTSQGLSVPAKSMGRGSAINGGELLMLALATRDCNDLHREAARLAIPVDAVTVEAAAEFTGVGLATNRIRCRAVITSSAPAERLSQLLRDTDAVAEVHNTIRSGIPVELVLA